MNSRNECAHIHVMIEEGLRSIMKIVHEKFPHYPLRDFMQDVLISHCVDMYAVAPSCQEAERLINVGVAIAKEYFIENGGEK